MLRAPKRRHRAFSSTTRSCTGGANRGRATLLLGAGRREAAAFCFSGLSLFTGDEVAVCKNGRDEFLEPNQRPDELLSTRSLTGRCKLRHRHPQPRRPRRAASQASAACTHTPPGTAEHATRAPTTPQLARRRPTSLCPPGHRSKGRTPTHRRPPLLVLAVLRFMKKSAWCRVSPSR